MRHLGRIARTRLLIGASAAAILCTSGAALAQDKPPITIAPQPLAAALYEFGGKTGTQVIFPSNLATAKQSRGVAGESDERLALTQLLAGTGLSFRREGDVFVILQQEGGSSPQAASADDGSAVEALIVTAQKKEEQIQDVPIAISAFTQESLDAQKLEGGFDLLKAIPNVTFSKNNFTGYNFSIRGVGTKAVSASTDPGVAVAFNNSGLIVNRLFEQEYFDVERVEVLRGPQGTLYGRNATSGVINVISAKPRLGEFEADVKLESGNYNAQRVRAMVNLPIGDTIAVRGAFAATKRDGYGYNSLNDTDVDDRDLWSSRLTLGFSPNERVRANLLWEHFQEDDRRVRTSKQLCHRDDGPLEILGVPVPATPTGGAFAPSARPQLSQGCKAGSLYADSAFETPRGNSLPYVIASRLPLTFGTDDVFANREQSRDLRVIESTIEPKYRAKSDIFDFSFDFDLTDALTLSSQTVYVQDEVYSTQDLNRFKTAPIFIDTTLFPESVPAHSTPYDAYYRNVSPGGVFCDPQLGCSNAMVAQDLSQASSTQFNQEFRLQSNFDGPVNFSLGANYTNFQTLNDYYVMINLLSYIAASDVAFNGPSVFASRCYAKGELCVYVDPNPLDSIDGDGHNYFRSMNPYRLSSSAVFGEVYWQATPTVRVTAGLRMTWDRKDFTPVPSQTLLKDYRELGPSYAAPGAPPEACTNRSNGGCSLAGDAIGGRGYPAHPDIIQEWAEPSGRLVVDWKPDLTFTEETMVYASYSHGYKGGGANPPGVANPQGAFNTLGRNAVAGPTFEPEFVDAFEIGNKNTLLGGALILNGTIFYYDYRDYQVSKIVDRSASNENFDAKIWGLELEWIFSPTRNLRFNGTFGHLDTEIAQGEQSIDLMDRTQGNSDYIIVKPSLTQTSNCVVPAAYVAGYIANRVATGNSIQLDQFCPGGNLGGLTFWGSAPIPGVGPLDPDLFPNGGSGFFDDVGGNELPNAPHWTSSFGAQYRMELPGGWDATLRGDFYWQSQSYARVYNTQYDKLRAWTNTNISLWFEKPDWGVKAEVYLKNVFDETPITDAFLYSDDTALVTNVFTLDPRLVGVSISKTF